MSHRMQTVEGARLVCHSCTHLSDSSHGAEACFWQALAGLAVTVAWLAERWEHPTFDGELRRCTDGAEASVLMLRALTAIGDGEDESAGWYAGMAASLAEQATEGQ